jgi:hypothetical protein
MNTLSELNDRIAALPDRQAVAVLARVLERQGVGGQPSGPRQGVGPAGGASAPGPDPARSGRAGRPRPTGHRGGPGPRGAATPGRHRPRGRRARGAGAAAAAAGDREFDPTMLAIGALVLFVFRADITLAHSRRVC